MNKPGKYLLSDIAVSQTGPFGSQLHEKDYVTKGTPIVTVEHLGEIGFILSNLPLVSDEDKKRLIKYTLKEGDIVFSRVGSVDRCTYVSEKEDGWMFSGRCLRVRLNDKADARFISFYFRQKFFKEMMLNISVGATMPSLNTSLMDNIPLFLPAKDEQQKIAAVLSALDAKIELNNRINAELEAMAKTLYDYWFVQFDFPDKNGKPYKSSGGKMVWSGELKRDIPEGWTAGCMSKFVELERGISYTSESIESKTGVPMINLGSISVDKSYRPDKLKFYSGAYAKRYESQPGELLIACTDMTRNGDIVGCPITTPYTHEKFVYSMDLAKVKFISDSVLPSYLYFTLRTDWYHKYIKKFASGTNVQHLDIKGVMNYKEAIPPMQLQKKFDELFIPINKQVGLSLIESQKLAELRDWLLPMLMNGQVTVK